MKHKGNWHPTDGLILEKEALESIKSRENIIITAGPGAGKTELLAQKSHYLLTTGICEEPHKILAISFKRDAAENLAERIKYRVPEDKNHLFISKTFDSFAKSLLDRFIYSLPDDLRPNINYEVDTNLSGLTQAAYETGKKLTKGYEKTNLENDLIKENLLSNNSETIDIWKKMLKGNEHGKSYLTFKMINRLVIILIQRNPYIHDSIIKTYKHVFLDEFQDTTYLQYELFNTCFKNSDVLITAVGDNKQKIMAWAGAMTDAFSKFEEEYYANAYNLLMNHRSAPNLLKIQRRLNTELGEEDIHQKPNDRWSSKDGQAEIWHFQNNKEESDRIAEKISSLQKSGVELSEICILVKQLPQYYTLPLKSALEKYSILARNESIYQDMLSEKLTGIIISTLKAAINSRDPDAWLEVINIKLTILNESQYFNFSEEEKLINESKKFLRKIKRDLQNVEVINDLDDILKLIISFYGVDNLSIISLEYNDLNYVERIIINILDLLFDYFEHTGKWTAAIDYFEGKNSVPIMTIHKSKGLEFNTVFLVGLDDKSFWSYKNNPKETTSTFFVAVSRAKERFYSTYSKERDGLCCKRELVSPLYKTLIESGVVIENDYTQTD